MKSREKRQQLREQAEQMAAAREARGDAGQLARLETRGHGHCKEAEKLRKKLDKPHTDPDPVP